MDLNLLLLAPLVLTAGAAGARLWTVASRAIRTRRWIRYLRSTLPTWGPDDELGRPLARTP